MLQFEWRHGVDGGLFQGIDGAGVFLGVGEAAVSENAGYGFDVGTVAQQIRSAAMMDAMPGDVFVDTGTGNPVNGASNPWSAVQPQIFYKVTKNRFGHVCQRINKHCRTGSNMLRECLKLTYVKI